MTTTGYYSIYIVHYTPCGQKLWNRSHLSHHFVPNKSKITFLNAKWQRIEVFHQLPYCEKIQGIQRNLSLCRAKQKNSGGFAWPLSPQIALHEKLSCRGGRYDQNRISRYDKFFITITIYHNIVFFFF